MRTSEKDYAVPNIRDELRYVIRHDLMQNTARDTLTIRKQSIAGSAAHAAVGLVLCRGRVVGGSGVHWSGHTWRWTDMGIQGALRVTRSAAARASFPPTWTIADWGITYAELEPYYDKFEHVAAVSGKAGNLRGSGPARRQTHSNHPRQREYPLPPLATILAGRDVCHGPATNSGYHPFPRPTANCLARLHQS